MSEIAAGPAPLAGAAPTVADALRARLDAQRAAFARGAPTYRQRMGARAAGNHVMLEPSEVTPRSAEVIAPIVDGALGPDHVHAVTGWPEVASAFSSLSTRAAAWTWCWRGRCPAADDVLPRLALRSR